MKEVELQGWFNLTHDVLHTESCVLPFRLFLLYSSLVPVKGVKYVMLIIYLTHVIISLKASFPHTGLCKHLLFSGLI